MKTKALLRNCLTLIIFFIPIAHGGQVNINTQVLATLVAEEDLWGGCMAKIRYDPQVALPACGRDWVTFSCSGDHVSKDIAYRMLDTAQLAQVTNRSVFLMITDTKMHNGYCFARRIDLLN